MKYIFDKYYNITKGVYPFLKYCPKCFRDDYIKRMGQEFLNYDYNWKQPKTFNEKIRWLLFNEKLQLKTVLSDKILVKNYVASKIGAHHSSEIFGIWDRFTDIDFSVLPDEFVLKANHGWKMNIIIKNKRVIYKYYKDFKKITDSWLSINFEHQNLEPQYKNIKRKLFAEFMRPADKINYRTEIKVHCFNENPLFIEVPLDCETNNSKYHNFQFYSIDWELQPFSYYLEHINTPVVQPENLDEILNYAEKLCKGFTYVRIDFAQYQNFVHVVEMSFSPCGCFVPFRPLKYDYLLGEMLL